MQMPTIVINTTADLTPKGKRTFKVVKTGYKTRGRKCNPQLRWYVGGKCFRTFDDVSVENLNLTQEWIAAAQ